MYKAVDNKTPALCIFLDLKKAFDTVCHKRLLEQLERLGFRGTSYRLFENYLQERNLYVKINGELSDSGTVTYGVPQGTVLGPILFIIYMNDLLTINTSGSILSFADDTAIFLEDTTWENLRKKAESELTFIKNWFDNKKLTINYSKTYFLPISSYQNHLPNFSELNILSRLTQTKIKSVSNIKYLGIYLDNHLRWDVHVKNTHKKIRGLLHKFKVLRDILKIKETIIVYKSLVESILRYGIIGWGGVAKSILEPLQRIQNQIIKIIYSKNIRYTTDILYNECKLFDIRQIYSSVLLLNQFKNKNQMLFISHDYHTRSNMNKNQIILKSKKTIGQRYFKYYCSKIYNILPSTLRNKKSYLLFKKSVNTWILENRKTLNLIIDKV